MKRLSHTLRTRLIGAGLGSVLSALLLLAGLIGFTTPAAAEELLVKLVAGLTADQQADVIARNGGNEVSQITALRLHVIEVPPAELDAAIASYEADAEVERVELNATRKADSEPVGGWDPLYMDQWYLPQIDWDLPTLMPSGNAVVALLDTGVDATHPDLAGKVLPGTSILNGGSGTTDPSGHGTQMAGIIAAVTNNGEGGAGVAYAGVQVLPVTVLGADATGQDSDVIAGVIWAADNGADVILMAFSNPTKSGSLQDALDYAWGKGVVLVAATGNADSADPTFPAGHRGVMGISATTQVDSLAPGSNHGLATFLGAPGIDILTTGAGNRYVRVNGTSTSAAIVAGVAGFMKAADRSLSNGVIVGRLGRTADPAGTQDETGNGRVNMARALTDTGTESVQPAGVEGGGGPFEGPYVAAAKNLTITFAGAGTGTVLIDPAINAATPDSCTSTCTSSIAANNTTVTLTATVGANATFAGWGTPSNGSCTGNTCSIPMNNSAQSVSVRFKANQTITVTTPAPANVAYDSTFSVAASASSGLDVAITVGGVCMITDGGTNSATVKMTSGMGICTVYYNQAGNDDYNAATEVTSNTTATKANQTITVTLGAPGSAAYDSTFTVAATASSLLPVAITTTGVCTGSGIYLANVTMTSGTGTCTVHYNQAGNDNYNAAPEVTSNTNAQKADATCAINGYSGVYDGEEHGASGSCIGVGDDGTLIGLNLGEKYTNVVPYILSLRQNEQNFITPL